MDKPRNLKKAELILSSGSNHMYGRAIYGYGHSFLSYLKPEDMGIYTAYGKENKTDEKMEGLWRFRAGNGYGDISVRGGQAQGILRIAPLLRR